MKMKKTVFALSIFLMLLLIVQVAAMFMPYIALQAKITTKDLNPGPQSYSLFDFAFGKTSQMTAQLEVLYADTWSTNANVTSFAVLFALAAIVFFFCLFSRKTLVGQLFALGYIPIAIYSFWANPFLELCSYPNVISTSRVLTVIISVVILVRVVLWFIIRFITKGYGLMIMEQEGELGLNPQATWKNMPRSAVWTMVVVGMLLVCLMTGFFVANHYHVENYTRTAEYKQNNIVELEATVKDLNKQIKALNAQIEELQNPTEPVEEPEEEPVEEPTEEVVEETTAEEVPEETVAETTEAA